MDDVEPPTPAEPAAEPLRPAELEVDARGLRCPLPIIRLAKVARDTAPGTVITLLSTDPAAEPDVAAWCRMRHHHLLTQHWSTPTPEARATPEAPATPEPRTLTSRIQLRP